MPVHPAAGSGREGTLCRTKCCGATYSVESITKALKAGGGRTACTGCCKATIQLTDLKTVKKIKPFSLFRQQAARNSLLMVPPIAPAPLNPFRKTQLKYSLSVGTTATTNNNRPIAILPPPKTKRAAIPPPPPPFGGKNSVGGGVGVSVQTNGSRVVRGGSRGPIRVSGGRGKGMGVGVGMSKYVGVGVAGAAPVCKMPMVQGLSAGQVCVGGSAGAGSSVSVGPSSKLPVSVSVLRAVMPQLPIFQETDITPKSTDTPNGSGSPKDPAAPSIPKHKTNTQQTHTGNGETAGPVHSSSNSKQKLPGQMISPCVAPVATVHLMGGGGGGSKWVKKRRSHSKQGKRGGAAGGSGQAAHQATDLASTTGGGDKDKERAGVVTKGPVSTSVWRQKKSQPPATVSAVTQTSPQQENKTPETTPQEQQQQQQPKGNKKTAEKKKKPVDTTKTAKGGTHTGEGKKGGKRLSAGSSVSGKSKRPSGGSTATASGASGVLSGAGAGGAGGSKEGALLQWSSMSAEDKKVMELNLKGGCISKYDKWEQHFQVLYALKKAFKTTRTNRSCPWSEVSASLEHYLAAVLAQRSYEASLKLTVKPLTRTAAVAPIPPSLQQHGRQPLFTCDLYITFPKPFNRSISTKVSSFPLKVCVASTVGPKEEAKGYAITAALQHLKIAIPEGVQKHLAAFGSKTASDTSETE
ncbi:unnamed protein product [Vitrella brassicaformis CCMP3155]|uniref:Uncharacterized protein n=3 Tax=Vitrella brassicaformis TaxID=1169539 RepID=A0A0G4FXS6_VITBC|nr:unnamed protein product [Vitrella brassicaformis CCMP3155]|eukprot:CEM19667.1 unnamed protein product [Vitrella brassicaformis CCMP3155]